MKGFEKLESDMKENETNALVYFHKSTTPDALRTFNMVPGYTGYIPGRLTLCGERYSKESESATAKFMKKQLQWMKYESRLIKTPLDLPKYFSLWYEIPRVDHHICRKCINRKENIKECYC